SAPHPPSCGTAARKCAAAETRWGTGRRSVTERSGWWEAACQLATADWRLAIDGLPIADCRLRLRLRLSIEDLNGDCRLRLSIVEWRFAQSPLPIFTPQSPIPIVIRQSQSSIINRQSPIANRQSVNLQSPVVILQWMVRVFLSM